MLLLSTFVHIAAAVAGILALQLNLFLGMANTVHSTRGGRYGPWGGGGFGGGGFGGGGFGGGGGGFGVGGGGVGGGGASGRW